MMKDSGNRFAEMTRLPRRAMGQRGFSLVELMVLIGILAVLMGASRLMMRGHVWSTELEASAQQIQADIAATRMRAIAQNRRFRIVFDKNRDSYRIEREAVGAWEVTRPSKPVGDDVDLLGAENLVFLSTGILEGSGRIDMKNDKSDLLLLYVSLAGQVEVERSVWTKHYDKDL